MDKVSELKFNGTDFTSFISFVKSMNSKDKSTYSKVALLHVEDNRLVCRAIDDTSNSIEYYVELYNKDCDNLISDFIAISINDLSALIKCANSNSEYGIRKCFGQFEFNVIGNGWLPFKTINVDSSKFIINGNETQIGTINSVKLRNAISSVLLYTQDCTYARDKYIQFDNTKMTVTSRLSSVVMSDSFPEMTLHRDDAYMLKSLLKENFEVYVSSLDGPVERLMIYGHKFKLTMIASGVEMPDVKYMSNDIENYITVDCDELCKIVALAEEYSASKHVVGLSVKDGNLNVNIKNLLTSKHTSTLNSTVAGIVNTMKSEAEIPAHSLFKALKLFQDKRCRNINIYITDEMLASQSCIIVFYGNTQAIINIKNG